MRCLAAVVAFAGCGRIAFDPLEDGSSGGADPTLGDVGVDDGAATVPVPIAWWKLDENAGTMTMDAIGTAHGTLSGGSLPTWTSVGQTGSALVFSGNGQRVALGTPAVLANLGPLSISAWIRPAALTPAGCIMDKGRATDGWLFAVNGASPGSVGFFSMFQGAMYTEHQSTPDAVAVNVWSHVVVTWDGSGTAANIRLYVDAVEVTYAVVNNATGARPDDSSTLAHINCTGQSGFAGTIDDVRVFDRILTAAQIAQLAAR